MEKRIMHDQSVGGVSQRTGAVAFIKTGFQVPEVLALEALVSLARGGGELVIPRGAFGRHAPFPIRGVLVEGFGNRTGQGIVQAEGEKIRGALVAPVRELSAVAF